MEAVKAGFVDAKAVFIDATHIKANENNHKYTNEVVKIEAKHYQAELQKEIEKDRADHGKKPLKPPKNGGEPPTKTVKQDRPERHMRFGRAADSLNPSLFSVALENQSDKFQGFGDRVPNSNQETFFSLSLKNIKIWL